MSAFHDSALIGASGQGEYQIERSLRFNSADSAYLSRTPVSAGNRKTWTWAGWVKKSLNGVLFGTLANSDTGTLYLIFTEAGALRATSYSVPTNTYLETSQVFRDYSAWYHVVWVADTTQAVASDRMKLYINGIEITAFSIDQRSGLISQNSDLQINLAQAHDIGRIGSAGIHFNGYLADVHFIDGQALAPTSFGFFDGNGIWQPKAYTDSYGTNGFHLPFNDNSTAAALGTETSGNGNTWTVNNISVTAGAGNDSLVDSPTNYGTDTGAGGEVRGNYATLNPLRKASNHTLSNGNLDIVIGSDSSSRTTFATIGVSSGKWYWEATVNTVANPYYPGFGVDTNLALSPQLQSGDTASGFMYLKDGQKFNNGSLTSYGASFTSGDIIGIALDMDAGTITFHKNGSTQGQAFSGISGTATPCIIGFFINSTPSASFNFGQRPFAYTAPSGFKALNTANLPTPTIADGSTAMDVVTYTGNGSSPRSITGLGFNPDFVWIKERSAGTYFHRLFDAVRGTSNNLYLPGTQAENTYSSGYANVSSFNSDGFTLTELNGGNVNSATYVAWTWDAGSSTVTNNDGTITSQVRANPSAGFSIVSWVGTGAGVAIGHGLGVAPKLIIIKARSAVTNWVVLTTAVDGSYDFLFLNLTNAKGDDPALSFTTSTFNPGGGNNANPSGQDMIAYCFAPVEGYSAFGSYTGNGSADGPFVFCNFRPRWVMIKPATVAANWIIKDSSRPTYNVTSGNLYPNLSNAEDNVSTADVDFTANGFKIRGTYASINSNGATYLYCAFAENPFSLARAR